MRKTWKTSFLRYVAVLLLASGLSIVSSGSSNAAPLTCGGAGGFEGYGNYSRLPANARETPIGVSGVITATATPSMCGNQTPPDLFSMVWVMLTDRDTHGLVQAGLIEQRGTNFSNPSTCMQDFYEWHHDSNSHFIAPGGGRFHFSTCISVGSKRQYYVSSTTTNLSNAHLAVSIAPYPGNKGGALFTTQWNIAAWTFIVPQYFAETDNYGADIVGTASSKFSISGMGIQPADGSAQVHTPCYLQAGDNAPRGNVGSSGCYTTYQWSS